MNLPFSSSQFFDVFRSYNETLWPVQVLLVLIAAFSIVLSFHQIPRGDRINSSILAVLWIWMGLVYHLFFFSSINPVAVAFGSAFILQGLLFLWYGTAQHRIRFQGSLGLRGVTGILFVLYALVLYPLLGASLGHPYPQSPTFGLPCPTTIFTFGVLLWTTEFPRRLMIIPALWALIGFTAAFQLEVLEDVGLLVAGVAGTTLLAGRRRSSQATGTI
ncbi:MAG: hypothetical protein HRF44_08785 [Ignavibacterium sp.]|jgi:hypothetical protein